MFRSNLLKTSGVISLAASKIALCQERSSDNNIVGLYLSDQSRSELREYLGRKGLKELDGGNIVVVRRVERKGDDFVYQPLFGERAAFRLKGVVTSAGASSGIGRISTMAGELSDDEYTVSLPLDTSGDSMDLPSRLSKVNSDELEIWEGTMPTSNVSGRTYPSAAASVVRYPFADQLVIDGRLCSSEYIDDQGNCTFDRDSISKTNMSESEEEVSPAQVAKMSKESIGNNEEEEVTSNEKAECPLCRFMKAGPCKPQFLEWDDCVQSIGDNEDVSKCFSKTVTMLSCMRNYEYYDIMTAGTARHMAAAAAAAEAKKSTES